ncbi:MAG: SIMPL domain-containing protein [Halorhabdus sp.]
MQINRSTLLVAAVAALLLAAVGAATAVTPTAQPDQPVTQIDVAASAEVSAHPDQAVLRLGVVATAEDARTARDQVAENVTALRAALSELNVSADQIETAYYDIGVVHERYKTETGTESVTEYRAVHTLTITLNRTDRVGTVIDAAIDSGANRVDGVSFTLSAEKRHELRQDALEKAMDRALTDAETLASSAHVQIVGASAISASDVHISPYRVERAMLASGGDGAVSTTIESGPVEVSASVQVVYNATGA